MTRLVPLELRRFFWRRLTRVSCVGLLVVMGFAVFAIHQQASDSTPARVQERVQEQQRQCQEAQAQARQNDPAADLGCSGITAESFASDEQVGFVPLVRQGVSGLALVLAFVGYLVGAGFVAAELTTGSMATWLTFEPRRLRVFASKHVAVALGMLPVSLAALAVFVGGVYASTRLVDVVGPVSADQRGDLLGLALRTVVVTSAAAVGGAVLGTLTRHTAAALGVAIGYAILVEGFLAALITRFVPDPVPWLVQPNFQAWVSRGYTYRNLDSSACAGPGGGPACQPVERTLEFGHASLYLGVLVAVALALGAWVFQRRDVS